MIFISHLHLSDATVLRFKSLQQKLFVCLVILVFLLLLLFFLVGGRGVGEGAYVDKCKK